MSSLISNDIKHEFANDFVNYLNESCTAFHAVDAARTRLVSAGYKELYLGDKWILEKKGKYFFTKNSTSIIAFTIGGNYNIGNGLTVLGAHTDSPCFKIKPVTCHTKLNSLMLNTQPYGGGLWYTWFDRDLGIAGRLIVRGEDGDIQTKLVRIDEPIARIPSLAIHLDRTANEKFSPNLHDHCQAILSCDPTIANQKPATENENEVASRLHPYLLRMMAKAANVDPELIEDMELQLIDVQPSTLGCANDELLFSGRLDNLCSTYQSLRALIDSSDDTSLASQQNICMAMLFDHEEVGSDSCQGAGSSIFMDTIRLILSVMGDDSQTALMTTLSKSFICSVDMAHAQHPNYSGKHDSTMAPKINGGLVIKQNANQRYATNAVSASLFRRIAKKANVPVQEFTVRSDTACGSTIGPILATLSGILTVDVGTPQFSMHSIRECMGTLDAYHGYAHLKAALIHHPSLIQPKAFH